MLTDKLVVESSSKSHLDGGEFDHLDEGEFDHLDGGEFDHLVAYLMACTIENVDEHELKDGAIRFGSLDEVSVGDDLGCLNVKKTRRMEGLQGCSTHRARGAQSSQHAAITQ